MVKQNSIKMQKITNIMKSPKNVNCFRLRPNSRYNFRKTPKINYGPKNHGIVKLTNIPIIKPIKPINSVNNKMNIDEPSENIWKELNSYVGADGVTNNNINYKKEWVTATSIKNYLLKDPIIDWLNEYYVKKGYNENSINIPNNLKELLKNQKEQHVKKENAKLSILFEKGNKFEDEIINYLKKQYSDSVKTVVVDFRRDGKKENVDKTIQYMRQGVPIIDQAVLTNAENRTWGIADILIRSDWINYIFEQEIITKEESTIKAPNLNGNYHYIAIDIKWTTLALCSREPTIRNSDRFPAYKGQLAIYNAALGLIQGYTPPKAYILAKGWKRTQGNIQYVGTDCFDLLGEINYDGFDKKYIELTKKAIKWVREVRYNGSNWTISPPSVPELYPNMCNRYDTGYHSYKKEIANDIDELTQIWMVGIRNRNIAHENGIYKWSDPNCNAKAMGINGKKTAPIVDKILAINRKELDGYIYPKIIQNNTYNWQKKHSLDFYVDFETINGIFYESDMNIRDSSVENGIVFMIGVGWEEKGNWKYVYFSMDNYSLEEEMKTMDKFTQFILNKSKKLKRKPSLFHWGNAEKTFFNIVNNRHDHRWSKWEYKINWVDMCKIFREEPIVVRGAFKFGIKVIANAMNKNDLIKSNWASNGPEDGLEAMIEATEYYKFIENMLSGKFDDDPNYTIKYKKQEQIFDSIVEYNEVDCKAVWEIINYLRDNHTK